VRKMHNLILFDVDGTLTEARAPISTAMLQTLRQLCRYAEIGFLTGSGLEYIKQQLWPALNDPVIKNSCHLLPCNGTEYLIIDGFDEVIFKPISKEDMRMEIEEEEFLMLMRILCQLQGIVANQYDIPLTGNHIQNRGSMINWCPIGRSAPREDRAVFKNLDETFRIREEYIEILREQIKVNNIDVVIKLGGDTSFDIYPKGWDKTYALKHFEGDEWNFWFVGDRCSPSGNDYEIFSLLKDSGQAFETGSPAETMEIIDFHILRNLI